MVYQKGGWRGGGLVESFFCLNPDHAWQHFLWLLTATKRFTMCLSMQDSNPALQSTDNREKSIIDESLFCSFEVLVDCDSLDKASQPARSGAEVKYT